MRGGAALVALLWTATSGAAEPPACRAAAACQREGGTAFEHQYSVQGETVLIEHRNDHFKIICYDGTALDCGALPSFASERRVRTATVDGCALPTAASLAAALLALNVSLELAPSALRLLALPPQRELAASDLAGLAHLAALELEAAAPPADPARASADFLAALGGLRSLRVRGVRLARGALRLAPRGLVNLTLDGAAADELPDEALAPDLRLLTLVEGAAGRAVASLAGRVGRARALTTLTLDAPRVLAGLEELLSRSVRELTVRGWAPTAGARPPTACAELRSLRLFAPAVSSLPARWLGACERLRALSVRGARRLTTLPEALLAGAVALEELSLTWGALASLPDDLFSRAPALRSVDLTGNALATLPSGAFARSGALRSLSLARNRLTTGAAEEAAGATGLVRLDLSRNRDLGALCDSGLGPSPLASLARLESLSLAHTGASSLCADWRLRMPRLRRLDLSHTRVTFLQRRDLEFEREVESTVSLEGANVTGVAFDLADYASVRAGSSRVTVALDSRLRCDCSAYWTRRALVDGRWGALAAIESARCEDGRRLEDLAEDELTCAPPERCPAGCACAARPAGCACPPAPAACACAPRRHVRVACEGAGLERPPRLALRADSLDLRLARNRIAELRRADLPPNATSVDVRHNALREVDADTVAALVGGGRTVRAAGNPWSCSCESRAALAALRAAAADRAGDWRCADGRPPPAEPCSPLAARLAVPLGAGLSLALAAVALLACLLRRDARLLAKLALDRAGLWRRGAADAAAEWDVFVAFAHEDEKRALEVCERVARWAPAARVQLQHRDWAAGGWIPAQAAASAAGARRSVALVSAAFLSAAWGAGVLRATCGARRPPVVVLLDAAAAADAGVRAAGGRRLRWGRPLFWEELRLELPLPRPRPP